jgi:magnesium-transporting ATPase (P-type)
MNIDGADPNHHIIIQFSLHIAVVTGIVIAVIGASELAKPPSSSNSYATDHALQRAGYLILLFGVNALTVYALMSIIRLRRSRIVKNDALILAYAAVVAIVFAFARIIYGVAFSWDSSPALSPFSGTFAVKFVLIFLVLLCGALTLVVGGFITRNIATKGVGE